MSITEIQSLVRPELLDRRVQLNVTVRDSTFQRLDKLVAKVQKLNPEKKRSHIVDHILSDTLDTLKIDS